MKLVSYKTEDQEHLGIFISGNIYNLNSCDKLIPNNMKEFLLGGEELMERGKKVNESYHKSWPVNILLPEISFCHEPAH